MVVSYRVTRRTTSSHPAGGLPALGGPGSAPVVLVTVIMVSGAFGIAQSSGVRLERVIQCLGEGTAGIFRCLSLQAMIDTCYAHSCVSCVML